MTWREKLLDLLYPQIATQTVEQVHSKGESGRWLTNMEYQDLLRRAEENAARAGHIEEFPEDDFFAPDRKEFDSYLEGTVHFNELTGKRVLNGWLKFQSLLQAIVNAYFDAFVDKNSWNADCRIIAIDNHSIHAEWTEHDDMGGRHSGGEFSVPIDFVWTDWRQRCDEEHERKELERARQQEDYVRELANRQLEQKQKEYQRALQVVESYKQEMRGKIKTTNGYCDTCGDMYVHGYDLQHTTCKRENDS